MNAPIEIGSVWRENRSGALPDCRRVVKVSEVDGRFVSGTGWWQNWSPVTGWHDADWTGSGRKTRVLVAHFRRRYALLTDPYPSAVGGKPKAPSKDSSDLGGVEDGESR